MIDRLSQHEALRRDMVAPKAFPWMIRDQPDGAERKRLEIQRLPLAIPGNREKRNAQPEPKPGDKIHE